MWDRLNSKEYENYIEKIIRRTYPKTLWQLETQTPVKHKGSPIKIDFTLKNRQTGKKVVIDAKSGRVTINDIRQIEEYREAIKASKCLIYTQTPLSELSKTIKDRAKKSAIELKCSKPRDYY